MTTVNKSFTENIDTSYKSTWTFGFTGNNVTITGSTFNIPALTVTAKYVYSGKTRAEASVAYKPVLNGSVLSNLTDHGLDDVSWASGATKTLPKGSGLPVSKNTSSYFTSSNKTTKSITLNYRVTSYWAWSHKGSNVDNMGNGIDQEKISEFTVFSTNLTVTLNVPPTVTVGTPTSGTIYQNFTTYSVPITQATAAYGGDIKTVTLTAGQTTKTLTYSANSISNQTISLIPTTIGTYNPTLTVTDSRGLTKTINLPEITVTQYNTPTVSFDVYRTDQNGVKSDEGIYGLIKATMVYTMTTASLTAPSVTIKDSDNNDVDANITWFSSYSSLTGVSTAISDWSTIVSGDMVYGLINADYETTGDFAPEKSYTVTLTETDTVGGHSESISQTMSTAFYTIDFQAGGKEIAFGGPANDDLTNYPDGLFKCNMKTQLNNDLSVDGTIEASGDITINGHSSPIGTTASHIPDATSCANTRYRQVAYLTLDPGTWIISAAARFQQSNTTGIRKILITNDTSNYDNVTTQPSSLGIIWAETFNGSAFPASGPADVKTTSAPLNVTTEKPTIRLIAYQSSGSAMNVTGRFYAIRIK